MFLPSAPSKNPTTRLGRRKVTRELNSAAVDIDNAIAESTVETPVLIFSPSRKGGRRFVISFSLFKFSYGDNECLTVVLLAPFHVLMGEVDSVVRVAGEEDVIRRAQPLLILVVQDRRQCRAHCRSGAPPRAPDLLALLGADQDEVAVGAGARR